MVAGTQHVTKTWQPPLVDQARYVVALRMAMGDGFWFALGSVVGVAVREVISLFRHRGDQREAGIQWFVDQLKEYTEHIEARLAQSDSKLEQEQEKREKLAQSLEMLSDSNLRLAADYEEMKRRAERAEAIALKIEGRMADVETKTQDALPAPVTIENVIQVGKEGQQG